MNIIVLAGGYSNERDVSLSSGGSICRALRERGHNAYLLDAFLGLEKAPENLVDVFTLPGGGLEIATGIQTSEPDLDALWASRPGDSPSFLGPNVLELCGLADITFLALHGGLGENGKLQAAFDTLGIRYTGPDSLGCALSMDKGVTKDLFHSAGVPTPYGTHVSRRNKDISGGKRHEIPGWRSGFGGPGSYAAPGTESPGSFRVSGDKGGKYARKGG